MSERGTAHLLAEFVSAVPLLGQLLTQTDRLRLLRTAPLLRCARLVSGGSQVGAQLANLTSHTQSERSNLTSHPQSERSNLTSHPQSEQLNLTSHRQSEGLNLTSHLQLKV